MVQSRAANEQELNQGSNQQHVPSPANLMAIVLRGMGQFFDMQTAVARNVLRSQMRAAAALGLRDYSPLLQVADERALSMFSVMTENMLELTRQAESVYQEIQSHYSRLFERQMIDLTERAQDGISELRNQASESMEEINELSRQQADEMSRTAESLREATRFTLREGGEQFRATMRQGREVMGRQAESLRNDAEEASEAGREAMQKGGKAAAEGTERTSRSGRSH